VFVSVSVGVSVLCVAKFTELVLVPLFTGEFEVCMCICLHVHVCV